MVEGTHLDPARAHELGIVEELVESTAELVAVARRWILAGGEGVQPWDRKGFRLPGGLPGSRPELARLFMAGTALVAAKTWRNYPAPRAILSCVYEGSQLPMDAALDVESQYFVELLSGPVARNMIRTLFVAKGAADRLKSRPVGVPGRPVAKLGVIGAGMMGAGIAEVAARAGIGVVLLDRSADAAEKGRAVIAARLAQGAAGDDAHAVVDRIHAGVDFAALAGCDLVIEAVFEDRAVKADVTRRAAAAAGPDALLASNTSTLPIASLAKAAPDAARFIGIHFFSPVGKMPLVEIIRGPQTSEAAVAPAMELVRQHGKTPLVVRGGRGINTTRVLSTWG
jgi:3-hydroxyacyl-CoA dehydrogenase/enoyl-CoA hydratase/3-hydroxybutyryl-CoA epimerase